MNNKKGFTLVELLAVIVVLAIILTIAVPGISGVIKSSTKASFKSDAKMVLTAIDYKKLETEGFDPLEITKENMLSTIGLNNNNYEQVNISVDGETISLVIVGKGKWAGFTAYGTIKNMKVVNTEDYDIIPPSITIIGDNPKDIGKNSTYVDEGATAYDLKDGDVEISSTIIKNASGNVVSSVDTSTFTTYTITYTAVDSQGNTASSVRRVNVVDKTKPVITILGDNPVMLPIGTVYSDAGATATDETDGNITSKIITTGSVNPNVVGSYYISYDVSDDYGNASDTATRTINVIDNIAPTVEYGTNGNSTYAKNRSTAVTVNDNVELNNESLKYLWSTSTTTPEESNFITTFSNDEQINTPVGVTGSYYLWILAKDIYDNVTIIKSNVFNLDNTVPVITLNGNSSVTINKGSTYSDAGATATDNIDGNITNNIVITGSVNPNIVGSYTITYNVSDSSGNASVQMTRTINVVDVLAPVITVAGNNPATVEVGGSYTDAGATAMDDVDGDVTSRIVTTGSVNPNVVGTYTITYTVKDNANNQSVATRTVNVVDTTVPVIATSLSGSIVFGDPTFASGINSMSVYNNTGNGNVVHSRVSMSTPVGSYAIKIDTNGVATPGVGGFVQYLNAKANGVYIHRMIARIPVGYTVERAANPIGDNPSVEWLTSREGTGNWKEYSFITRAGATGTFSSFGHIYLIGPDGTPSNPVTWYVAYSSIFDTTIWGRNTTIALRATDNANGIVGYGINQSGSTAPTFTTVSSTKTLGVTFTDIITNGTYYVWVRDSSGNVSNRAVTVSYVDRTAPTITLNGSNPVTVSTGSTYTDAGATATDSQSGINGSVVASGTVNTNVPGTYTITYNASDKAGNAATPVTRTVSVVTSASNFGYTGSIQNWTASVTGNYQIEVWGAQGGSANGYEGGRGAYAKSIVNISAGTTVSVLVGGLGAANGGGAGGTYIYKDYTLPLAIAGGGGGAGWKGAGLPGLSTTSGGSTIGAGGVNGYGGGSGLQNGPASGGAGWLSDGTNGGYANDTGGKAPRNGGTGGIGGTSGGYTGGAGGYGGGGGAMHNSLVRGGGGGGYSGGAGGSYNDSGSYMSAAGGGGGSYATGSGATAISGNLSMPAPSGGTETGHTGSGYARITFVSN